MMYSKWRKDKISQSSNFHILKTIDVITLNWSKSILYNENIFSRIISNKTVLRDCFAL